MGSTQNRTSFYTHHNPVIDLPDIHRGHRIDPISSLSMETPLLQLIRLHEFGQAKACRRRARLISPFPSKVRPELWGLETGHPNEGMHDP